MIEVGALKYYGIGKYSDPVSAQQKVDRLREKHPDREYTLLINMRASYKHYHVVQCKTVTVHWPEEADLDLPPAPKRPPLDARWSTDPRMRQVWDDYEHERTRRSKLLEKALAPLKQRLHERLNP